MTLRIAVTRTMLQHIRCAQGDWIQLVITTVANLVPNKLEALSRGDGFLVACKFACQLADLRCLKINDVASVKKIGRVQVHVDLADLRLLVPDDSDLLNIE